MLPPDPFTSVLYWFLSPASVCFTSNCFYLQLSLEKYSWASEAKLPVYAEALREAWSQRWLVGVGKRSSLALRREEPSTCHLGSRAPSRLSRELCLKLYPWSTSSSSLTYFPCSFSSFSWKYILNKLLVHKLASQNLLLGNLSGDNQTKVTPWDCAAFGSLVHLPSCLGSIIMAAILGLFFSSWFAQALPSFLSPSCSFTSRMSTP